MKNSKAKFYFIIYWILMIIGTKYSLYRERSYFKTHGEYFQYPPYADYQQFLLFVYLPFLCIPLLCLTVYYAGKENKKKTRIAAILLLIHHVLFIIQSFIAHITKIG